MKIVILVLLLAVVASLFSGLYFVYKDKGTTNRAVISLTIRIALSLLVFLLLIGSPYLRLGPVGELFPATKKPHPSAGHSRPGARALAARHVEQEQEPQHG